LFKVTNFNLPTSFSGNPQHEISQKPVQWTQDVSCERKEGRADITIRTLVSLKQFCSHKHFACRILFTHRHLNKFSFVRCDDVYFDGNAQFRIFWPVIAYITTCKAVSFTRTGVKDPLNYSFGDKEF
jgi:hypothetical protein